MMRKLGETIYGNHPVVKEALEEQIISYDIPDDKVNIGKYGTMRSLWLKEQNMRAEQEALIATGHPNLELAMFNEIVADEVYRILKQLMKADKANEPDSRDILARAGWREMHKATAEEIVAQEMIYTK